MKYILNHCLLCFQVQELVFCPCIKDARIGRLKEFLVQDFMRLILLVNIYVIDHKTAALFSVIRFHCCCSMHEHVQFPA